MQTYQYELMDLTKKAPPLTTPEESKNLHESISTAVSYLLSLQKNEGHWWFTLEANESIGAEFIFLQHYLNKAEPDIVRGIANRIRDVQREDNTWSLYKDGPPDLSTTIECYFALKLTGWDTNSYSMRKAREFILSKGGIVKSRVFTKIHLALFGIVPWSACPAMPPELIFLPSWFPVNIYEFSSWARASIVPLLIIMSKKPVFRLPKTSGLEELFCEEPSKRDYSFKLNAKNIFSWGNFFILFDKLLKFYEKSPLKPFRNKAILRCSEWAWDHVKRTEDIYPALAYAILAFKALGYANDAPQIKKPLDSLKSFQQHYDFTGPVSDTNPQIGVGHKHYTTLDVPALPEPTVNTRDLTTSRSSDLTRIHQQCCISPVWDTPWTLMALLEAGVPADTPALVKSGRWLISKQITNFKGDWAIKNPNSQPGGWAFEFRNDCFPDVDDTIEVISVLQRLAIPSQEREESISRGLAWLLSMQNNDGGWGAFDKNQTLELVNKIPFSDHGACLDPSSPDITGRMIELLASRGMTLNDPPISRALDYLIKTQEPFGGWFGRWGINYIYGTWCVLTGLAELGWHPAGEAVKKAVRWLKQIQNEDGGFGESPESYSLKTYVRWKESVPSQTAWGLMGLISGGEAGSEQARRAALFLVKCLNVNGSWDEQAYTGTGFPGHFYIRYHGYRHFFPLLALARYKRQI